MATPSDDSEEEVVATMKPAGRPTRNRKKQVVNYVNDTDEESNMMSDDDRPMRNRKKQAVNYSDEESNIISDDDDDDF